MTELHEAAERVRRILSGPSVVLGESGMRSHHKDVTLLARAYLADNPPDGEELITEEWLQSVGATKDDHPRKWTFNREDALDVGLWNVDDGWKAVLMLSKHASSSITRGLKTRRDIRLLARALGVELGEGK